MEIPETCWYCHKPTMVEEALCWRCSKCGATWLPTPSLRAAALEAHRNWTDGRITGSPGPGAIVRDLTTGELKRPAPE